MQGLLQVRKSNFVTEAINSLFAFNLFELCCIFYSLIDVYLNKDFIHI